MSAAAKINKVRCARFTLVGAITLLALQVGDVNAQRSRMSIEQSDTRLAHRRTPNVRIPDSQRTKYPYTLPQTSRPDWHPETEVKDPIQIIVSLPEQRLTVYVADKPIVTSRISSGKVGYSTPSGVFSILGKNKYHRSNIYSGAPMPFMQRLTWSGIALHGSNSVPNSPASHGCVRLPTGFAGQLFNFTQRGAHVVIANESVKPQEIEHEMLFEPSVPPSPGTHPAEVDPVPEPSEKEKRIAELPLRILVTRFSGRERLRDVQSLLAELGFEPGDIDGYMGPDTANAIKRFQTARGLNPDGLVSDGLIEKLHAVAGKGEPVNGRLYVRQNFKPVFEAPVVIRGGDRPLGAHLYTIMHFDEGETATRWLSVTLTAGSPINRHDRRSTIDPTGPSESAHDHLAASSAEEALGRIAIPADARRRISEMLTPGSSLAISNDGISYETTPKGTDFIVLMQ